MKRCPIMGCKNHAHPSHLCCKIHWFKLPRETRTAILESKPHGSTEEYKHYLDLRFKAITYLNKQEEEKCQQENHDLSNLAPPGRRTNPPRVKSHSAGWNGAQAQERPKFWWVD